MRRNSTTPKFQPKRRSSPSPARSPLRAVPLVLYERHLLSGDTPRLLTETDTALGATRQARSLAAPPSSFGAALFLAPLSFLSSLFVRLFLPRGRLPPEYLLFQALDSLQALCSYLRGVLTLHATRQTARTYGRAHLWRVEMEPLANLELLGVIRHA